MLIDIKSKKQIFINEPAFSIHQTCNLCKDSVNPLYNYNGYSLCKPCSESAWMNKAKRGFQIFLKDFEIKRNQK